MAANQALTAAKLVSTFLTFFWTLSFGLAATYLLNG